MYRYHRSRRELKQAPSQRKKNGRSFIWISRWAKGLRFFLLTAFALGLAAWGVNAVRQAMTNSEIFELREVRILGLERLNEADVLERLRPSSGKALFDLDLVFLQGSLLTQPWLTP